MDRIDISEELKKIHARETNVSSTTLLKTDTLRIVLMALRAGAALHEHHADGRLSVQVLEGEIDFSAENSKSQLGPGMLLSLGARVPHQVIARSDAALLLTIAWPSSETEAERAEAAAHRKTGYS
ncbi:MAG TPA: cupin domain-containing protein [Acidobacteriaceae bacterium]|nr:cupin domain-containing protein [Acidobacteriaceae bacterium]